MNWLPLSFQETDLWILISLQTTHHKSISVVSMGLQALSEFITLKKFHMKFWMITGSDMFCNTVRLPRIISFLLKKKALLGE